jgi:transposase
MSEITTIGLDLAKSVFQVHGIDEAGGEVTRKAAAARSDADVFCWLAAMFGWHGGCATAHYWARELTAPGHEVRLMPPQYVKAYLNRNKNDAADAEAICEAVRRPSIRFVPVKTKEQQSALVMPRALINSELCQAAHIRRQCAVVVSAHVSCSEQKQRRCR